MNQLRPLGVGELLDAAVQIYKGRAKTLLAAVAIPVIPVKPGSEAVERDWPVQADEERRANPFAALKDLKKH